MDNFNLSQSETLSILKECKHNSKVGFEKEGLRIRNSSISKNFHSRNLGSALCNQYITTDFSEAQLELVTPPFDNARNALNFLDDIHHFVTNKIEEEVIWPLSMPIGIESDKDIRVASFGSSNLARFKEIYRNGLSERYGKMMQIISGLHYNYSIPIDFWKSSFFLGQEIKPMRSAAYFNMLRNIYKMNWLIFYLFGASPAMDKRFLSNEVEEFEKLDEETIFLPYATSLRMSNFGYQNSLRKKLEVSINSVEEYISDLKSATDTACDDFLNIEINGSKSEAQINENILQIDDEYYAVARAKSKSISDERTISKLRRGGVDFIELRSLDLNPFSRIGIEEDATIFLEIFLTYCFTKPSKYLSSEDINEITNNDLLAAISGRMPKLKLLKNGKKIPLKNWGNEIMDNLLQIAGIFDSESKSYTDVIENMREKINDPNKTLSGLFLDRIRDERISFTEFGLNIAELNKTYYKGVDKSQNLNWSIFEAEVRESLNQQFVEENSFKESYEEFVKRYFRS